MRNPGVNNDAKLAKIVQMQELTGDLHKLSVSFTPLIIKYQLNVIMFRMLVWIQII